jgi:DNA-binding NarL/FixJ family response regulator
MNKIRLLLVDDHELIRKGLTLMLETQKKINLEITHCSNGKDALKLMSEQFFDLIILDINMPVLNGISTLKKMRTLDISTPPVLMLSMHKEEDLIKEAIKHGASGYILKNSNLDEILKAILSTLKREQYYSNDVSDILTKKEEKVPNLIQNEYNLSLREIQIISMLVKEMTSQEIGDKLFISKRTVEGHRNNIMEKIGVKSAVGLVKFAVKYGIE